MKEKENTRTSKLHLQSDLAPTRQTLFQRLTQCPETNMLLPAKATAVLETPSKRKSLAERLDPLCPVQPPLSQPNLPINKSTSYSRRFSTTYHPYARKSPTLMWTKQLYDFQCSISSNTLKYLRREAIAKMKTPPLPSVSVWEHPQRKEKERNGKLLLLLRLTPPIPELRVPNPSK